MNIERVLANVKKIKSITPIENADRIVLLNFFNSGWQCVGGIDEFKENDLCIYFEIDSFLPEENRYEFLRSSYKQHEDGSFGFFIKSRRFKGVLSQGLTLPLSKFPELENVKEGDNVTETLNIKVYEPKTLSSTKGTIIGDFPHFLIRSDQEKIQNRIEYIETYKNNTFEVTEKLEGTSCTMCYYDKNKNSEKIDFNNIDEYININAEPDEPNDNYYLCSRQKRIDINDKFNSAYSLIFKQLNMKKVLKQLNLPIALQGEIIGPRIEKNVYELNKLYFYIYNIFYITEHRFLNPFERMIVYKKVKELCPNIEHVPIMHEEIKFFNIYDTLDKILNYSEGKSSLNQKSDMEGIVVKGIDTNISFKGLSNDVLLKKGKSKNKKKNKK